jgi:hypothetical protein
MVGELSRTTAAEPDRTETSFNSLARRILNIIIYAQEKRRIALIII